MQAQASPARMIDSLQTENVLDCDNDHYVWCWLLVTWHVSPDPQSVQWNNATHQQLTKLAIFSLDISKLTCDHKYRHIGSGVWSYNLHTVTCDDLTPPTTSPGRGQLTSPCIGKCGRLFKTDKTRNRSAGSRCSVKTSVWESSEDGAHELLLQSARTENCSLWKAAKIVPRNSDCLWLVAMTLFD